jgi:Na+/H+-dicarboxylate symporter
MSMQKAEKAPEKPRQKWHISLGQLILLALLLGVVTGLFFGEMVAPLEQVGIAFIRMLQITVIPYICVSPCTTRFPRLAVAVTISAKFNRTGARTGFHTAVYTLQSIFLASQRHRTGGGCFQHHDWTRLDW